MLKRMGIARRAYVDADLPRLQAVLADWRRSAGLCGYCHVGDLAHRLYADQGALWPVEVLAQVWEDASGPVGIVIPFRFGTVFDVFTSPALRGTEAEHAMLRSAYEITREHMSAPAAVVTDVFDRDEQRARLLGELGFRQHRKWDVVTEASLDTVPPAPELPEGFTVRCATWVDGAQLAAIRNACFGATWTERHYRQRVMDRPGYDPAREILAVAPDGRIAAFARTWLDAVNAVGHFEPVGTHPSFRRKGLARAVMLHGMRDMRASGMTRATVQHDADNQAAEGLYSGLGFEARHVTFGFRRR